MLGKYKGISSMLNRVTPSSVLDSCIHIHVDVCIYIYILCMRMYSTYSYSSLVPEESMVLNAVLPKLLAAIVCVHVEPDSIVLATLLNVQPDMYINNVHVYIYTCRYNVHVYIHELYIYIMCIAHYKLQKKDLRLQTK